MCSFLSEKAMAPHSCTLAWKIPWAEESGSLQSMGSLRVGHDWATSLSLFTFMHWRRKWQPTPVFLPGESQGPRSLVGSCLWGHRVGHDWSDIAAAAAAFCEEKKKKRLQNNTSVLIHQYDHILLFVFLQFSIMGIYYFNSEKFVNKIIVIFLTKTLNGVYRIHFFIMIKMLFPLQDIVYSRIKRN